jgi:hypothetical protein
VNSVLRVPPPTLMIYRPQRENRWHGAGMGLVNTVVPAARLTEEVEAGDHPCWQPGLALSDGHPSPAARMSAGSRCGDGPTVASAVIGGR